MPRRALHRFGVPGLARIVLVSFLALGIIAVLSPVRSVGAQPVQLLTVTKTPDNPTITAGDQVGFTLTITSTGTGDALNAFLADNTGEVLPSDPVWTETTGNPACSFVAGFRLDCSFGTIPSGAPPIILHITAPTTPQDCGTVTNLAHVGYRDGDGTDAFAESAAVVSINCPTSSATPAAASTASGGQSPPATATSDTTGGVTDLPATGGGPIGGTSQQWPWLLIAFLVATGVGIVRIRAR